MRKSPHMSDAEFRKIFDEIKKKRAKLIAKEKESN